MDKIFTHATILIVPGLRAHVPQHWQTLLAERLVKVRCVRPVQNNSLHCADRVARIQEEFEKIQGPVIVVAHSAGVLMCLHWVAQYQAKIQAALLVTPPDLNATWPEHYPSPAQLQQQGWSPLPQQKFAFPSMVVASSNDYLAQYDVVAQMAQTWGSQLINAGAVGHLNPASGFGLWPQAEQLIQQLDENTTQ